MGTAEIETLQRIAQLTNQHLGGGCCDRHYQENLDRLHRELAKFEDDSFVALKPAATPSAR